MAHYNLIFQGKIVDGASLEEVKNNVAKLFKADAAKTDALFSGKSIVIKKNLDTESAKKYLAVLKKAGAIVKAVKVETDAPAEAQTPATEAQPNSVAPPPPPSSGGLSAGLASLVNYNDPTTHAQQSAPTETASITEESTSKTTEVNTSEAITETSATEDSSLQLAPVDSGPLSNGTPVEAIEIPDIDHLTMAEAETGSLEEFAKKVEAVELPDISELSMSEANSGSLEGIEKKPDPVELPDISELDMAELDETPLSSDSPKPAPVDIPDVSGITMSEAQEGTLEGLEKKPDPVEIPDISHLDVEKEEKQQQNQGKATFQID